MSFTLRSFAVASCAAILVTGVVTSVTPAVASAPAAATAAFQVRPSHGPVGSTITLTGADFSSATGVSIHDVAATFTKVSDSELTAVVPDGATSGRVKVTETLSSLVDPRFVVQQPTASSSSVSKSTLTFTHSVIVTAHETTVTGGQPVVGQTASLQHLAAGSRNWVHANGTQAKMTAKRGGVQWKVQPRADGSYRVNFHQSQEFAGSATNAHTVRVLPLIHLRPLHTVSEHAISRIHGTVRPHLPGRVFLQRHRHGAWRPVKHMKAKAGHFAFTIRPSGLGKLQYRVVRHADATHGPSVSRTLHLSVVHRTLSLGDSGRDVKTLQNRLHKLHYDVGPRNSSYGYDTLHAVTAFEKQNGLPKDGQAGTAVWNKLNNPKKVHLRHPLPSASLAVEVNLRKQILVLARHGKVWRILDTSTAGGYYYTNSEGESERAVTPTGHFTIQYKQTGWQKSDLGELYYPSYFTNTGYAIHGEGNGNDGSEVPPYPNSHGCVRISNDAVLRYYNKLVVGTSVWIFG
jgi:5-hydroxyisourate hydrolase-like protein (transthyretin family)